jgi:endonuclease G
MPSNSPLDKLTTKQRILVGVALLAVAAVVIALRGCPEPPRPTTPSAQPPGTTLENRNIRFGMPAEAKADPSQKDAYLIDRPHYVLSYNDSTHSPNWVSWSLNKSDIGHTKRSPAFETDPDLPKGFYHVSPRDYTGSGFDRGHMCPSKDRSSTEEINRLTFYTTNIVPQSPACNRGAWERFEDYCRRLTADGSELYIVAGPHGSGGTGERGERKSISKAEINVPAAVWKVVLVLPGPDETPTANARTLAVWMPNDQTVTEDWKPFAVSVAEVEKRTGLKFFPLLPDEVGNAIKGRVDRGQ